MGVKQPRIVLGALVLGSGAIPRATLAQPFPPPPDYGLDWVTIGAPGNDPVPEELFIVGSVFPIPLGTVDYEYRIMRTQISVAQWFEFVQAYLPFYDGPNINPQFLGLGIGWTPGGFVMTDPPDYPSTMSWEYAARYCNWLHNGKALTAEAFESGVYDTSTFTVNPDGTRNHQFSHHHDALFWIPTLDEWIKAAYYDPDRFGPDQPGWWYNPGGQDEFLVSGPPGAGQTNAGPDGLDTPVGSYPDVNAPWGLLDTSGGIREWTETFSNPNTKSVFRIGSDAADFFYTDRDPVEHFGASFPQSVSKGVRLASAVQIPACPGDANIDGEVSFGDVTSVLGNWLDESAVGGDANGDGMVNFNDITTILGNWQAECPGEKPPPLR